MYCNLHKHVSVLWLFTHHFNCPTRNFLFCLFALTQLIGGPITQERDNSSFPVHYSFSLTISLQSKRTHPHYSSVWPERKLLWVWVGHDWRAPCRKGNFTMLPHKLMKNINSSFPLVIWSVVTLKILFHVNFEKYFYFIFYIWFCFIWFIYLKITQK